MRLYEVLFIIAPNTEEGDINALITQISDVATNQGATIAKLDRMGRRKLAYPIKKFNEGYYVVLTIEGTGAEIAEIERRMRVIDAIIRYLTVRIDEDLKRADKFRARRSARAASRVPRTSRRAGAPAAIEVEENMIEEEEEE
ncbi:MAG TPA: 30S ribosomal protein S6 [Blastocatellia bacterium]|jgi:small subunit ribosomal protein S6